MAEVTKYKWGNPIGEFKGTPIYGGDCWNRMPAVYMTSTESSHERYAETEEEWELFGVRLPNEVNIIRDIEVGCNNYLALIAAGVAVRDCLHCPLRQAADEMG
jgi:hypothetical protein